MRGMKKSCISIDVTRNSCNYWICKVGKKNCWMRQVGTVFAEFTNLSIRKAENCTNAWNWQSQFCNITSWSCKILTIERRTRIRGILISLTVSCRARSGQNNAHFPCESWEVKIMELNSKWFGHLTIDLATQQCLSTVTWISYYIIVA